MGLKKIFRKITTSTKEKVRLERGKAEENLKGKSNRNISEGKNVSALKIMMNIQDLYVK